MTFFRQTMLQQWRLLEAAPVVCSYVERTGFIQHDGNPQWTDFIVDYVNGSKLAILYDDFFGNESYTELLGRKSQYQSLSRQLRMSFVHVVDFDRRAVQQHAASRALTYAAETKALACGGPIGLTVEAN